MAQVNDLTVGNPFRKIIPFYIPLLCTYSLQQLYNIVDSMIVGKGIGDDAFAAVGNMGSLTFLAIGSFIGLANGFAIPIGQSFGARAYDRMRSFVASAIMLALAIIVFATTLTVFNLETILVRMRVDPTIIGDSLKYGYIIFGGMGVTLIYNLSSAILRSLGDSRTPFIAILIASASNVAMDYFFIFILETGVAGAAIATVCSQFLSACICIRKLMMIELVHLKMADFKINSANFLELLRNGVPMGLMNSVTALGCMVVQFFVNGYGVVYTAAYAACSRYINLFMQPSFAVGHAMSAFTSQNYGARNFKRIREGVWVCSAIALVSYAIFAVIMIVFPKQLAGLVLNGSEQIELVGLFLPKCGIMMWGVDLLFVFRSGCQGMGHSLAPMISGLMEMVMRVTVIVFFMSSLGFVATAYAEIAAWHGALLINLTMFIIYLFREISSLKIKSETI